MKVEIVRINHRHNTDLALVIRNTFLEFEAPVTGTVFEDPTTDNLYSLFQKEGSECWVAESFEKAIGSCGYFPTRKLPEGYAELVKFYLSPEYRGQGIGKELLYRTIDSASLNGYKHLYLESLPEFEKAVELYQKAGFRQIDHSLGESGLFGCNLYMVREL